MKNYNKLIKIQNILLLYFLFINNSYNQTLNPISRVIIGSGAPLKQIQSVQMILNDVLKTLNQVYGKSGTLERIKEYCNDNAYKSISSFVDLRSIHCIDPEQTTNIIYSYKNELFEVGISLTFEISKNIFWPENVIFTFDNTNRIVEFRLTKPIEDYKKFIEFGTNDIKDEEFEQIIRFLEIYRNAYIKKDISYIDKVISDYALIITGVQLDIFNSYDSRNETERHVTNVRYNKKPKSEYMEALKKIMLNADIDLNFRIEGIEKHPEYPDIYGVHIYQEWISSYLDKTKNYKDKGYLFLMFDFQNSINPIIHVRVWQVQKFITKQLPNFPIATPN